MERRFDLEKFYKNKRPSDPRIAATPVTTRKGGKEQKGQHRGKGETRQRSAAAVERRILRGAARRAEAWLSSEEGQEAGQCKRPRREELDYVEALRLQSVPESAVPEFLNERNTVQGGLPTWGSTHGASQRVWGRFQREFPQLSQVVSSTPGRTARRSYALEEGGRRVAQGIVGEADQRARRAQPGVRTEAGEEEEEEEERTLLGDGDETVVEEEAATVLDDNETHLPEEFQTILPDEDSETEWETAESSSVAASEVARAVRDLDLRSEKAKEEVKEKEEEQARSFRSNWSSSQSSSSASWSQSSGSRSNWTSDSGAWAEGWYPGNSGYHRGWRGGRW